MGYVHGCDDECGDIHGKEFLNLRRFHGGQDISYVTQLLKFVL